jgi:hypothetical protein
MTPIREGMRCVPTDGATTGVSTDAASARPTVVTFTEMGTRLCRTISPCRGPDRQSVYTRCYRLLYKVGGGESFTGQHGAVHREIFVRVYMVSLRMPN